jgi:hypothetical protein
MRKILVFGTFLSLIAIAITSCSKDKGFVINSKQLIFNIDSMTTAGPIEKTATAKYDVDEIAKQYDVKVGKLQSFKFKSIAFKITEGDLRFDDFKYIKVSISANGLSLKDIVAKIDIPAGTDKEFNVTSIPDVDVLPYVEAGDITMILNAETNKDHTKAAKIQATPSVDVLGLTTGFIKL